MRHGKIKNQCLFELKFNHGEDDEAQSMIQCCRERGEVGHGLRTVALLDLVAEQVQLAMICEDGVVKLGEETSNLCTQSCWCR